MGYSIVLGGLLSYGLPIGGLAAGSGSPAATLQSINPRAGQILDTDVTSEPDPRAGTIIS